MKYLTLAVLAGVLAFAVYFYGGVLPWHWEACLFAAACAFLLYWVVTPRSDLAPRLSRWLTFSLILFPAYIVFQLTPLPASLLRALSPERFRTLAALRPIMPDIQAAPVSVMPAATYDHLLRIVCYVLVFLTIRELTWRFRLSPWALAFPLVGIAAVEAIWGLTQYQLFDIHSFARGTYVSRDHFAGLLEMAVPFPVAYGIAKLREQSLLKGAAALACGCLLMLTLVLSLSRAGLAAASLALVIVAIHYARESRMNWKIALPLAGILLLLILGVLPTRFINRLGDITVNPALAVGDRLAFWRETLHLFRDYPWFGAGLGTRPFAYLKYKETFFLWTSDFAHNDYLQLLAELGIVGFAIAAASMAQLAIVTLRATSRVAENNFGYLGAACAGAFAAILLHSFVDFNLYIPANAMLLAWILGIAAGVAAFERSGLSHLTGRAGRIREGVGRTVVRVTVNFENLRA